MFWSGELLSKGSKVGMQSVFEEQHGGQCDGVKVGEVMGTEDLVGHCEGFSLLLVKLDTTGRF